MRIVFEKGQNLSTFLSARLVFVTVLLGIAAIFESERQLMFSYIVLFTANTAFSLICWEWFRRTRQATAAGWTALTAAVVLDTLVLQATGGVESVFIFLYFFSIGSAGLLAGFGGSLWTAVLSAAGVLWLLYEGPDGTALETGMKALVYIVNFLLTAFLTSYVFERLMERERRHQETLGELEQTRLDTQLILDTLGTGVVVLKPEGNVLYSNPAARQMLGLTEMADIATRLQWLLPEHAGPAAEVELNGQPVSLAVSALHDPQGAPRGRVVLLTDLTSLKANEQDDRNRERLAAIGRLSRDLAHEVRNPLATVRGSVEMIRMGQPPGSELTPFLDLALRESDRLNTLLRDFLTFAHLDAPNKQPGDLPELVRKRLKETPRPMAIRDDLPREMSALYDADQMGLAVDLILLTLCEWADEPGEIRVEPVAAGEPGIRFLLPRQAIDERVKQEAFRPFSGVHKASSGLGLPTALRAVHAHGGKLTLHTEPGVGTWFELTV